MKDANAFSVLSAFCISSLFIAVAVQPVQAGSIQSMDQGTGSSTVRSMADFHKQKHTDQKVYDATVRNSSERRDENDPPTDGDGQSSVRNLPEQPVEEKTDQAQKEYQLNDFGWCLPDGRYHWETKAGPRDGIVPNPTYPQQKGMAPGNFDDSGYRGMTDQLMSLIPDDAKGTPITNAEFATLVAASAEATAERVTDAQERMVQNRAAQQAKQVDAANNSAECAEGCYDASMTMMVDYLLNVANENAATPTDAKAPFKTYSQSVWMVQQMYKQCYIPMAILFLLPGALLTQAKAMASAGMLGTRDEDTQSPFTGIIRAMIAVFLIPATQLTVSYVVDVGNSVTYCVSQEIDKHGGLPAIQAWAREQTYNTQSKQNQNYVPKVPIVDGNSSIGKIAGKSEKLAQFENVTNLSAMMQQWFNTFNAVLGQGLAILNGFQLIMMCYLFLLGPVAASFFAWPTGVGRDLFKKVFSNWLDGVVILALWKFWWCVALLCMVIRISLGIPNETDQYEMYYYAAFMAILMFVPFNPFEFRPGEVVSHVLEKAQQQAGKAGQGGAANASGPAGSNGASPGPTAGPVGARGQ